MITFVLVAREQLLHVLLAAAAETSSPLPSATAAVQVALIGALAPVVLVIVNEVVRRWRARPGDDPPTDGILAPVEEVPRAQYDGLLDRVAQLDNIISDQERRHELDKERWTAERREHEADRARWLAERNAREREIERLRERMTDEIERRARAEALLSTLQGRGSGG